MVRHGGPLRTVSDVAPMTIPNEDEQPKGTPSSGLIPKVIGRWHPSPTDLPMPPLPAHATSSVTLSSVMPHTL